MKKIIMLTMVLVMMLVSLGGCFVGYEGHGRGGGGHDGGGPGGGDQQRH